MKKHITLPFIAILVLLLNNASIGQTLKPITIKDSSVKWLINHVQSFHQYEVKDLAITVMEIANPDGSAHIPEGHEITTNLYFGVSEIDTSPEQNLFCIKNLYAVKNIQQDKSIPGQAVVSFNYVDISDVKKPVKKTVKIKLTLQTATIIK